MKHKKIFATIVAIACTLVLATGCSITSHEDVMKSDSATIQQSDKADSKDVQKDESDKASDEKKSDSAASADKSDKDAAKESGTSADQSSSNASSDKSDSSTSKPSGNSSSPHSGSSASKPSSGNSGSSSSSTPTPEPSQPAHQHSYTSSTKVIQAPTCTSTGVERHYCSCGDYQDVTLAKADHSWVDNTETVEHSDPIWKVVCNGCGAQFDDAHEAGLHVAAVFGDACSSTRNEIVGYNTYSETVNHGQICSVCGATQ